MNQREQDESFLLGFVAGRFVLVYSLLRLVLFAAPFLFIIWLIGGCTFTPEPPAPQDAQAIVDSMTIVRAKTGDCYGVIMPTGMSSNGSLRESIVVVPARCPEVP